MLTRRDRGTESAAQAPRVSLAPRERRHAHALFELLNDWQVVHMLALVPWPPTYEEVLRTVHARADGIDLFTILAGSDPVGAASVKRIGSGEPPRTMPRLGYWIGRKFWGRGYGTGAVVALTEHAFRSSSAERVGAGVFLDNRASRSVLEKLGFREVGRYMTHCMARGAEVETADMQITRARWSAETGRA